ncbi:MAG: cell division protein FtsZ [Flavobacteriaceae bacterium]|nr:cell division protein FtsZ [Flavobacteriaceae bacterium]
MNELKENIEEGFNFDLPKNKSNVIKVIGVGGGGGNAINYMFKQGISGVDFVVCNTDSQALEKSPVPIKIQLGVSLTEGLGAGANPEIGSLAAKESEEEIKLLLSSQTKMVFITAGMGGGTGTGAAPIIAQMSKQLDILTVGIVTIPFQFEGRMRSDQAQIGIEMLRENVDSLIVINNNKLRQVYGNLGFKAGFAKADEVLSTAARGIAEVITHHYRQNIDLKDAKTVLSNSGTAIMGSAVADGSNRAEDSVVKALDSPLLNDNKIKGCKNVLLLIVSGEDEITIDEIGEINDFIQSEAGNNTNIIMGIGEDKNLKQGISVTIIATGFNSEQQHEIVNTEAKKIIHTLEEEQPFIQDLSEIENDNHKEETLNPNINFDNQEKTNKSSNSDKEKELDYLENRKADNEIKNKSEHFEENNFIEVNQNTQDVEVSSTQITSDFEEEDDNEDKSSKKIESIDSIEVFDFEDINDMDSSQIKFDFNDNQNNSKNKKVKSPILEHEINNFDLNKENELVINSDNQNLSDNKNDDDHENISDDELKIEFKRIDSENQKEERAMVNSSPESPFDNSIKETVNASISKRKEELKKFNYSFKNNPKRLNEMDREPAYKRLGYDIDQKIQNEKKSPLTLDKDKNDEVQLRSNNSFLHDNVD